MDKEYEIGDIIYSAWKPKFIIWPRKINGEYHCFTTVYKRVCFIAGFPRVATTQYTDIFGVLSK